MDSVKIDELDRLVIGALLAQPRATHAVIGQAVRSSEATVSRRLARLRRAGAVRVVGAIDSQISHRARSVFVRLRCAPGAADELALPLAQWDETGSVKVLTGSVDCVAEIAYTSNEHLYRLMMHELPRFDGVMATFSNQVIRRFSTPHGWNPGLLPDTVVAELRAERRDRWSEHPEPDEAAPLSELDEHLVAVLIDDGRISWQDLAARCGVTPSTARRRTETLMAQGVLRMRTVVEPEVLGLTVKRVRVAHHQPDEDRPRRRDPGPAPQRGDDRGHHRRPQPLRRDRRGQRQRALRVPLRDRRPPARADPRRRRGGAAHRETGRHDRPRPADDRRVAVRVVNRVVTPDDPANPMRHDRGWRAMVEACTRVRLRTMLCAATR